MKLPRRPVWIVATLMLVAMLTLAWLDRASWLGHGPLTGALMVTLVLWPGIVLSALGAWLVVRTDLAGLNPYQRTAIRSEATLLIRPWRQVALATLAACLVVGGVLCAASLATTHFGRPQVWHLVEAVLWPQLCLLVWMSITVRLPVRLRPAMLLVAPLVTFWLAVAGMDTGSRWGVWSLQTDGTSLTITESPGLVGARCLGWLVLGAVCLGSLVRRGLARACAAALVVLLVVLSVRPPSLRTDIAGAENLECTADQRICWHAWGRAGSATFIATMDEMLASTPGDLRPARILGEGTSSDEPGTITVGYPAGNALEAVRPSGDRLRRNYVEGVLRQGCSDGTSRLAFASAAKRAFGLPNDVGRAPWESGDSDLWNGMPGDERALRERLQALPPKAFFAAVRDRRQPRWCRASAAEWLEKLR